MVRTPRRGLLVVYGIACLALGSASGTKDAAAAQQDDPQVSLVDVPCNRIHDEGGVPVLYAEHELAGAPVRQLGRVTIVAHLTATAQATTLPGYEHEIVHERVYARDSSLAVRCGLARAPRYDRVTLAVPRAAVIDVDRGSPW